MMRLKETVVIEDEEVINNLFLNRFTASLPEIIPLIDFFLTLWLKHQIWILRK